jgi:hypothetical protein
MLLTYKFLVSTLVSTCSISHDNISPRASGPKKASNNTGNYPHLSHPWRPGMPTSTHLYKREVGEGDINGDQYSFSASHKHTVEHTVCPW